MDHRRIFLLSVSLLLINCSSDDSPILPTMELNPGSYREIAYTDKGDAFWVTRAGGYHSSPWHGLTASKRAYFEDLFIYADGKLLPRELAEVKVDPVKLIREYPALGIRETWTLIDEQRTLIVKLEAETAIHWTVQPAILGGTQAADFDISTSEYELNAYLRRYAGLASSHPYLKLRFSQPMQWLEAQSPELPLYASYLTKRADYDSSHKLVISISLSDQEQTLDTLPTWIETARSERQTRLIKRLAFTKYVSNQPELDQSIAWAHASLDALIMNQQGKGIYAGLPWFDDYWGRDVFISFAGATLVSGQFEEARRVLLSFSDLQNTDSADQNYGRVPNRAQPDNIIYNTTDGTPWFVRSLWDYYRYTGDQEFLTEMWPAIQHATRGAIQNWTDASGLLRHADADTWMDAKGPDGAWSPRGDRAIEIQFIWRDQLEITRRLAKHFGDKELTVQTAGTLAKLKQGLQQFRTSDNSYFVDHLNADNSQDQQIRPNVFLVPPLFQETCDWSTFKTLAPQLISRKGVLSLSQNDANFHPIHHLSRLYVQDAAYHNGIIWTWNSAATISQSIRFHQYQYAQAIFDDLTEQIMYRGAIGTMAELTDGWPRNGEMQLSGTFSQAWSLAEYLRTFYQDILGIQPDLTSSQVKIAPRLLDGMEELAFNTSIGSDLWEVAYVETESSFDIEIKRTKEDPVKLLCELRHESNVGQLELTWKTESIYLRYEKQMGQWTVPGDIDDYRTKNVAIDIPINSLEFCVLDTTIDVPALKGPEHRLLNESEVVSSTGSYNSIFRANDPQGDDQGDNGSYVYPANPQFEAGIADIVGFQLSADGSEYLFELEFANLVDPGWHPEYGYQLTYCSIGISYDHKTGTNELGKNSLAVFKNRFRADQIIHVSGGILIVDNAHEPVAEYMPGEPSGAIGNATTESLRFRLPRDIFSGNLEAARFQIAVGCQDDHGGAGIGDYRVVLEKGSEWGGGGKANPNASNVYDWLLP